MSNKVFLSYSRTNLHVAKRLSEDLLRVGCASVWFDQDSIPVNEEWEREIEKGITSHDAFVLLWSPEAWNSVNVRKEHNIAIQNKRRIAILHVAGSHDDMSADVQKLQFIDLKKDYDLGFRDLLSALSMTQKPVSPIEMIRVGTTHSDAEKKFPNPPTQSWFVNDPNNSPAERRRMFVKFPIIPSGYCASWLVTDSKRDLELQHDLHFVLRFTDDGYRDSVQEVLDYLVTRGEQPQIIFCEGPRDADGKYQLPDDRPHVWHDAVELISRTIKIVGGSHALHFFLHAPQALSFAVGSAFAQFQNYHVYNLDRKKPLGERYKRVYSSSPD